MKFKVSLCILLAAFSAIALEVRSVEISIVSDVTRLTLTTNGMIMPGATMIAGQIHLNLPGIKSPQKVVLPPANGLVKALSWGQDQKGHYLLITPDENAAAYKAFAENNPDQVVLEISPRKVKSEIIPTPKAVLSETDFDVRKMGRTLLLDDDDGVVNGNAAAGVDVDWWYQRPMVYLRKEVESAIVRTGTGLPPASTLGQYDTVIYYSGCDEVPRLLEDSDVSSLAGYVRNGGHLLMFCQNLFGVKAGVWLARETLGIKQYKGDTCVKKVQGDPARKYLASLDLSLLGEYRPIGNWSDGFKLDPLRTDVESLIVGIGDGYCYGAVGNYGKGRLIICTFAQENLPDNLIRMRLMKGLLQELWVESKPE